MFVVYCSKIHYFDLREIDKSNGVFDSNTVYSLNLKLCYIESPYNELSNLPCYIQTILCISKLNILAMWFKSSSK